MSGIVLTIAVVLLVLWQGGFFSLAGCVFGVVASAVAGVAWLAPSRRNRSVPLVSLLFLCVALSYFMSALANGLTLTTFSEAGVWAGCAGVSILSAAADQSDGKRSAWLQALVWFGIATAVAGMFVCAGLLPIAEGMVGERLQFTFQYANAAAAWYGICTILSLLSPDERQRSFAALPAGALLLTESGGALIAFSVIASVIAVRWVRSSRWNDLLQALVQGVLAGLLFACVHMPMLPIALLALTVVVAACALLCRYNPSMVNRIDARIASFALAGVFVVCMLIALWLLAGRALEATSAFGERLAQMRDGISLWIAQPLLGIGPDNWQYLYTVIQTAPYYTTVVHCSYIQIALDSGVFGLGFFLAACAVGMKNLVRSSAGEEAFGGWAKAKLLAVAFLLAHALLDFDLQFAALSFLLAAMLSASGAPESFATGDHRAARFHVKGMAAGVLCLMLCLPLSVGGVLCSASAMAIEAAEASRDYEACERLFLGNPLAQDDAAAQSNHFSALYEQGDYNAVTGAYAQLSAPTGGDALHAALACYALGDRAQATAVLADYLEKHSYDVDFLDNAIQLADTYGVDQSQDVRLSAMIDQARASVTAGGDVGLS